MRLSRIGKKNAPLYRLVVMPKTRDPWSRQTEILGQFNPQAKENGLTIKLDRVKYWLSQGAEPTKTVLNLLIEQKLVEGKKQPVSHISKRRKVKLDAKKGEEKKA